MIRTTMFSLLLLLPGLALAGPGDLAKGTQTPADAAKAWEQQGLTPARALRALTQPLERAALAPGNHTFTLDDVHQRNTNLLVHVPKHTRQSGKYGLMVVLHGYGGNARQLFTWGQLVAPRGTVIAAVSAKRLTNELEGVDVPKLGLAAGFSKHWWSYRYDNFPLTAMKKLLRQLPIDTNRILLAGYSMGGFGTWNIGLRHHQHFAGIAPMAGGISRSEYLMRRDPRSRELLKNVHMQPVFFIHGDADPIVPGRFSQSIAKELTDLGAPHTFITVPGGAHVLRPFLKGNDDTKVLKAFLKKAVRDPNPRVVQHSSVDSVSGRAYWTRIDGVRGKTAALRAEVKPGNRIEVTTENVTKLTVYLDPDLVDVNKPVTLVLDGKVRHTGKVQASLKTVAETFARGGGDPHLTYRHGLSLDHHEKGRTVTAPKASAPRPKAKAKAKKRAKRWF